jgi:hypothetical protein
MNGSEKVRWFSRSLRIWSILLVGLVCSTEIRAQDRPGHVYIDSREGIGLLPLMWRGVTLQTGDLPEHVSLRTVCLGPDPVAHAWQMRRRGGSYDWGPLDLALLQLKAERVDIVLVLPVSRYNDPHWTELVTETVRHVGTRASLYEFRAEPDAEWDHYLERYEAGVWAVRQLGSQARVGGPGLDWEREGVEAFVRRCEERKLPLHTVTWHASVEAVDDIRRSIDSMNRLISSYVPDRRPGAMITGWNATRCGFGVAMSALMGAMMTDVEAICLADTSDSAGWTSMKGLNALSGVRLPVVIQAPDGGVSSVAHLDHDMVQAVFWHAREGGETPVTVTFGGLPWGDRIRIEQLRLTDEDDHLRPVFAETRPTSVDFLLTGEGVTAIRLVVE